MAKLIVNPTSSARREIPLPKSLLSIGRDPSNDLVLPDAMVSRRHAVIEFRGSQYFLRDCNSSNGSLVNGDRVSERNLRDGDLVAIGTARLLFREDPEPEELGAKVVQHPSAPRLQCPSCNADYRKGDQFCRQCGAGLAPSAPAKVVCTSCGTAVPLPARFCNACGSPLGQKEEGLDVTKPRPVPAAPPEPPPPAPPAPKAAPEDSAEAAVPEPRPAPSPEPPPIPEESEPLPPIDAPRSSRSAAVVEPALPPPRPVADAPPRPIQMPPRIPVLRERPRPVPPQGRVERAPREAGRPPRLEAESPAGAGRRLGAALVDGAIVFLGQALLLSPMALYWWSRELPRSPQDVPYTPIFLSLTLTLLVALLGAAYYVYFWGVRGATPGKQLFGLAVVGEDGAFPIGVSRAVARLLGYLLSAATLGIGFLMIAVGGQGLHDRVAGTRVVDRERG